MHKHGFQKAPEVTYVEGVAADLRGAGEKVQVVKVGEEAEGWREEVVEGELGWEAEVEEKEAEAMAVREGEEMAEERVVEVEAKEEVALGTEEEGREEGLRVQDGVLRIGRNGLAGKRAGYHTGMCRLTQEQEQAWIHKAAKATYVEGVAVEKAEAGWVAADLKGAGEKVEVVRVGVEAEGSGEELVEGEPGWEAEVEEKEAEAMALREGKEMAEERVMEAGAKKEVALEKEEEKREAGLQVQGK
ncbi:hypothetical protein DUNSADRAFT_7930 [Dunaliella salina]|uniref:Encoded protein n=1 Tax=Dunaliella salina TaxID=3046 RepID=A0ABZ3L0Y2_DUNSA|nr:hypothetical protein DUNSADRAFT_7930 [Dunaliella salina]|eukprot:KAF5835080.1 hypothetical protein DUNSADRAFT_7930 [Dunaliella salina]